MEIAAVRDPQRRGDSVPIGRRTGDGFFDSPFAFAQGPLRMTESIHASITGTALALWLHNVRPDGCGGGGNVDSSGRISCAHSAESVGWMGTELVCRG